MTEILAIFRSRSQAADCNARLKKAGINCVLINTPKEANVGCGLSVKYPESAQRHANARVLAANYSAFYGFMTMTNLYGKIYFRYET